MILDVISIVLLLVVLGVIQFNVMKRLTSIEQKQRGLIQQGDSIEERQEELIQQGDSIEQKQRGLIQQGDSIEEKQEELIQQGKSRYLPKVIRDLEEIRSEFIAYIKRESNILKSDGRNNANDDFIRYDAGFSTENGLPPVWINAWIPDPNIISAAISIDGNSPYFTPYYQHLKKHRSKIEKVFSFGTIDSGIVGSNICRLSINKTDVDLTQTANWETEFRWLRENLEKLYWVLRMRDEIGWDG